MTFSASASAKTILFGEHAVVYGEPAVAIPLPNTRTFAELLPNGQAFRVTSPEVSLDSSFADLPEGSGLKALLIEIMNEFGLNELPKDTLDLLVFIISQAIKQDQCTRL